VAVQLHLREPIDGIEPGRARHPSPSCGFGAACLHRSHRARS
jgi:hypothetical protein